MGTYVPQPRLYVYYMHTLYYVCIAQTTEKGLTRFVYIYIRVRA